MAAKQKAPVRRLDGQATLTRILDHAERLFSIDGYAGVSLRQITGAAGVDLALIKYYFGSKEGLFDAVLARRVDAMSEKRLEGLKTIEIVPGSADTIHTLLDAFVVPIIGANPDEVAELRNYRLLIALVANSKNWQDAVFKKHYDPVAMKYIDALCEALPGVPRAEICWGFSFFLGSLVNAVAETARIDRLSNGECRSSDLDEACRQLIRYSVSAFIGMRPANKRESTGNCHEADHLPNQ